MEPGRASQTAVMVCSGRAIGHVRAPTSRFSDPTALPLLPENVRRDIGRWLAGEEPKGLRGWFVNAFMRRQSMLMVARTVAVDDAIRDAGSSQVVVLGAGLDGRAWRMPELSDATVFEVDHPDSQRDKRSRSDALRPVAREIRFVSVDFARDSLDHALAVAGHDPTRPTTWVWEGVVMYLTREQIEATLAVVARRSAKTSCLVVVYHSPAPIRFILNAVVRRMGEPLRSSQTETEMRRLLAIHGFEVERDESLQAIGVRVSPELARHVKGMTHMRVAVARR